MRPRLNSRIPVVVEMHVECPKCRHVSDEKFEFDMPYKKAQPIESIELGTCPQCGAAVQKHMKRTLQVQ